jgi:hypothetical protein
MKENLDMNMFSMITDALAGFKWIEKPSVARSEVSNYARKPVGARIGVTSAKGGRKQGSVTLYEPVMKKMGWVAGDRVRIGVDLAGRRIALQRCLSGGYALSPCPNKDFDSTKDLIGKMVRSRTKFKVEDGDDFAALANESVNIFMDDCVFDDGAVIFTIGK